MVGDTRDMIRWILLFAMTISGPSIVAQDSDYPESAEHKQPPQTERKTETYGLNGSGNVSVQSANLRANSPNDNPHASKYTKHHQEEATEQSASLAQQDLVAQQSMAKAAWRMFFLSVFQFVVSIGGVILVLLTLNTTRKATKASEESAQAAMVSAQTAKQAVSSDRAHMTIDGIHDAHRNDGFHLYVDWRNYGRTPSILKSFCIAFGLADPKTTFPCFNQPTHYIGGTKVGPQQEFPCCTELIDAETKSRIIRNLAVAYVYARLEYTDGFDDAPKIEEAILKITPKINWHGYDDMVKRTGACGVTGCFKWEPVMCKSFIKPEAK